VNPLLLLGGAGTLVLVPVAALLLAGSGSAAQSALCTAAAGQASLAPLDADQSANAAVIVDVGERLQVPGFGQVIAMATALQESGPHNLTGGDQDSVGLFQQRPSQGWGSPTQILDPSYAATTFYNHLLAVPGWMAMPLTVAAQTVQRRAFPDAYAKWQTEATTIVTQLSAGTMAIPGSQQLGVATPPPAGSSPPPGTSSPATATATAGGGLVCGVVEVPPGVVGQIVAFAAAQVGKAYLLGANGPNAWDCSSLAQAAYAIASVQLPRTADRQYDYARAHGQVTTGPPQLSDLQPGDLLFSPGSDPVPAADGNPIGHVAIYAGNGVVIEAKGTAWGVVATTYTPTDLGDVTFVGRLVAPASATSSQPAVASSPGIATSPDPTSPSQKGSA
jgi:cell wall-associated NlpC family hydrolase